MRIIPSYGKIRYMGIDFLKNAAVALAPMAGVTDFAFRTACREAGAEITYTEMVSAKALCFGDKKSRSLLKIAEGESPCGAQIFGSDPASMAEGTKIAAEISGADFIDINMGCPMPKIVSSGDGSALMREPEKAARVIEAVVNISPIPVTVKIRRGWDKGNLNFLEIGRIAESLGVSAICIHGRTRAQLYSGNADWDCIRDLKRAVSIPVIANGDVDSAERAEHILHYTGADALMVGRASFGRPWIFSEIQAKLAGKSIPAAPDIDERCDIALRQFELALTIKGERVACLEARKHFAWYLKGIPYASYFRDQIMKITTSGDIYTVAAAIRRDLK